MKNFSHLKEKVEKFFDRDRSRSTLYPLAHWAVALSLGFLLFLFILISNGLLFLRIQSDDAFLEVPTGNQRQWSSINQRGLETVLSTFQQKEILYKELETADTNPPVDPSL